MTDATIIFTAEMAKQVALDAKKLAEEQKEKELHILLQEIAKNAKLGSFSYKSYKTLDEYFVKRLGELGYEVTRGHDGYHDSYTLISWS